MTYKLQIHKDAEKALKKAQIRIREKAFACIIHLRDKGTLNSHFPIEPLQGNFKKYKYYFK